MDEDEMAEMEVIIASLKDEVTGLKVTYNYIYCI